MRRPLAEADGRVLTEDAVAPADVPGYDRTAMSDYVVRVSDVFSAGGRSPNVLRIVDGPVEPGTAARVYTGGDVPEGADTVVIVEHTRRLGDELEAFGILAEGENIGERDEDIRERTPLFETGYEFRPSNIGPLRSIGVKEVTLFGRPRVSVVPTDEELVESDPGPGEVIETNGLTVSRLVERWGGEAGYRGIVVDDVDLLREAVESDLGHDIVVATDGLSVDERDLIPEVIDDIGEVLVHGIVPRPDHPIAVGVVEDTLVVMLPGYPVACVVSAFQSLRPVLKHAGSLPERPLPTQEATLTRKLPSSPDTRAFARVKLDPSGGESIAEPTRTNEPGILFSVVLADDWVVVLEEIGDYDEGDAVAVEGWEWSA